MSKLPPTLVLRAPLQGWVAPLDEVPDPVFGEKMMGDGMAIDPTAGLLCAPCDGEVIGLHHAKHAVTIRSDAGAEILIHVGLETVALSGAGFTPYVQLGQQVKSGDKLLAFDLDTVGRRARSLITPILLTNGDAFVITDRHEGGKVALGEPLFTLRRAGAIAAKAESAGAESRRDLVVPLAHGIHARPAARLADLAKGFSSEIAVEARGKRANVKSPVAVMGMGLVKGSAITLIGRGADAERAVAVIAELIESGMGERHELEPKPAPLRPAAPAEDGVIAGVSAAPGLALGVAWRLVQSEIRVAERGVSPSEESRRLADALASVRAGLTAIAAKGGVGAAIIAAHLAFLDDPELSASAEGEIAAGKSAGAAWRRAIHTQIDCLRAIGDALFVERIADLADIERQVQLALGGKPESEEPPPEGAILLAEDLLPSQLVGIDPAKLGGFATMLGGPTSHVAILAASMNIPALVACGPTLLGVETGTRILLDAEQGTLAVDPPPSVIDIAEIRIAERKLKRAQAEAQAFEPCRTKDGLRVEIAANLASVDDAKRAVAAGAEGCGLLRTEFLFLDRDTPPSEAEQTGIYRAIAEALGDRPMIVRTLDIGGDKPAAYLPIPAEENPALGLRGVRVSLWRPDLFEIQLAAILKGVPARQCRVMVPMVASLSEFRRVRALVDTVRGRLGVGAVSLGVMVETPAAAVTADLLASEADFLSIGTNDLTQYTLAMDRGNAQVAAEIDALHPAVLRMIAQTATGGARHNRWTGMCGGLASDLAAIPILIGLGVSELSVTIGQLPEVKALVRRLTVEQCRVLAEKALAQDSAGAVRQLIRDQGEM